MQAIGSITIYKDSIDVYITKMEHELKKFSIVDEHVATLEEVNQVTTAVAAANYVVEHQLMKTVVFTYEYPYTVEEVANSIISQLTY